jgi:orotidine-5'-phosphate decarboxylase
MDSKQKFKRSIENRKHICIGLDSDIKKIPSFLLNSEDPLFEFNKIIIDSTIDYAGAYKLNFAFYENEGLKGLNSLKKTIEYIGDNSFIIGDAKRGDIGNTSAMYASALFDHFKVDASTLHPYMGFDSISPFLNYSEKINFILALTSNPGANDFEKLKLANGDYLYKFVIKKVIEWNRSENCGIVFGATQLSELIDSIDLIKKVPVLLPGVGAQGGDLQEIVSIFKQHSINNFLINSSRGIIYKDSSKNFGKAAKDELTKLNTTVLKVFSI